MATDNFAWTTLTGSNTVAELNTALGQIDASLGDTLTITIDSAAAETVTAAQFQQHGVFAIAADGGDPPAGDVTITVPTTTRGMFVVRNDTLQNVIVTISGQSKTAPTIAAGLAAVLNTDGIDIMEDS